MEDAAIEALRQLKDVLPAKALLVAMQSPEDETLVRKVGVMAGVLVQPRAWTAEQLLGVLARCRLVVAMRLHALIFASAVGVPSLGIIYDPKVEQFVAATGQEGITLEEVASGGLAERVTAAWNVRDELASRLAERVPAMRESAAENFRLAGELLV
jgi:polysaccharide pyruvyl transferase WcaK-like protein